MRSPSKAVFLRTVALVFLLCTFSSVFARVPLVRRQSIVESQWDQDSPAVADGPRRKNNILNEQVVAGPYRVCCSRNEPLIVKAFSVCEDGMILIIFFLFSSQTLLPIYTYLFLPRMYLYGRKVKRKGENPTENPKANHEIIFFPFQSHQKQFATAPYTIALYQPLRLQL